MGVHVHMGIIWPRHADPRPELVLTLTLTLTPSYGLGMPALVLN